MKKWWCLFVVASLASSYWSASAYSHEDVTFHAPPSLDGRDLPFSQAVRVGDLLFLSGVIGREGETSKLAKGGIQGETRAALSEIKETVKRLGGSMDRVVKCTVFMADIAEWAAMNEVYVTFFPNNKPARSALGVNGLAIGARVEIECIAAL